MEWIVALEAQIEEARRVVSSLRDDNRSLKAKVRRLESKLASARDASSSQGDWAKEREQIRRRVDRLTAHLEQLLEE